MTNDLSEHQSDRARFGPFEVDLQTREIWKFGTRLKVVGQPFEILAMLLGRPGKLVTRDELRNRLWPSDTFVDFNHGLNAAVNKLREALSDSADDPRYIETLPRRGYRLRADVEWLPTGSPTIPAGVPEQATVADVELVTVPALLEQPAPSKFRPNILRALTSPRLLLVTGMVGALLIAAVILPRIFNRQSERPTTQVLIEHTGLLTPVSNTSSPSFSPDGSSVAFFRQRSAESESGI